MPRFIATDADMPALRRILLDGLSTPDPSRPARRPTWISVAVPDENGAPCGGLIGLVAGAWFSIDLLWLPIPLRNQGLGALVVAEAERRAAEHQCIGATVITAYAESERFYARCGYIARLRLPGLRPGLTQVTLQKHFPG